MGVFSAQWIEPILDVLSQLGSHHVLVLAADDGLDEISVSSPTQIGELRDGHIVRYTVCPEDFGMQRRDDFRSLQVGSPQESLAMVEAALTYKDRVAGDIVALNAGAAIYAANLCDDLPTAVCKAQAILHSGAALVKLKQLAELTGRMTA
jgi:anthranilate phosphoribosyltransferase